MLQALPRHGGGHPALRGPRADDREPQAVGREPACGIADELDQRDGALAGGQAHRGDEPQRSVLAGPTATLGEALGRPDVEVEPVGHHRHLGVDGLLVADDAEMTEAVVQLARDGRLLEGMLTHNRAVRPAFGWDDVLGSAESEYARARALV